MHSGPLLLSWDRGEGDRLRRVADSERPLNGEGGLELVVAGLRCLNGAISREQ
jgi:hypothetical protein